MKGFFIFMELLFLGDIVGDKSFRAVIHFMETNKLDVNFANIENVAGGFGITQNHYQQLIKAGFDGLTGGNHIWDKKEVFTFISQAKIARPYNFPKGVPGKGFHLINRPELGLKIGLINVLGRVFMNIVSLSCPFRACDEAIEELKSQGANLIIVDMHAEATAEKITLAHYLDGRVGAIVGTHTHIPTADTSILPKGTAYITDLGACMSVNSMLGMSYDSTINRFLTGIPTRMEIDKNPDIQINGVKIEFNNSFKAVSIKRIENNNLIKVN